ncbi:hypothetical protein ES703_112805 [subsurface metagenome]
MAADAEFLEQVFFEFVNHLFIHMCYIDKQYLGRAFYTCLLVDKCSSAIDDTCVVEIFDFPKGLSISCVYKSVHG